MKSPRHEKVRLRPTERAEFMSIAMRFGQPPSTPLVRSFLGWRGRARVQFFSNLAAITLLFPIGVVMMAIGVLVWWPLGLLAVGLVFFGLLATYELVRGRQLRHRIQQTPTRKKSQP